MNAEMTEENAVPTLKQIPHEEVSFHPHSFVDFRIRLFRWQGQLYRAIGPDRAPFFQQLFQDGVIQSLVDRQLLVESELTSLKLEGYETIVRHRVIPFTSYSIEWSAAMLKDAALTLLDFGIELAQRGVSLEDSHMGNILFDGCQPLFIDLGSIRPLDESVSYFRWSAYDIFCQVCFYPLVLMASGKDRIARLLMVDLKGIPKSEFLLLTQGARSYIRISRTSPIVHLQSTLGKILPTSSKQSSAQKIKKIQSLFDRKTLDVTSNSIYAQNLKQRYHVKFLKKLRRDVQNITLTTGSTSFDRSQSSTPSLSSPENLAEKQVILSQILNDLKPESVLDIGCARGWYALLAASLGSRVVAFDRNPDCVTQLYYEARERKLSILPLVMDFAEPTPYFGLSNKRYLAATERFQCDLVLALGLIHHLVFKQHCRFGQIVEGFSQFSKRWLVVEFISIEDREMLPILNRQNLSKFHSKFSWYTLENFIDVLNTGFRYVKTLPVNLDSRTLLLCEK